MNVENLPILPGCPQWDYQRQLARLFRKSEQPRPEPPKEGEDPLAVALRFAKRPDFVARAVSATEERKKVYWLRSGALGQRG